LKGSRVNLKLLRCPTLLSADLGLTAFIYLFHFFASATLRAHWLELNQNWPHVQKWVWFENACPKSGLSFPV